MSLRRAVLVFAALLMSVTAIVMVCGFDVMQISSNSMENTLHSGDYIVVRREALFVSHGGKASWSPRRGQIIVFRMPGDPQRIMVKRAIGVAGDNVQINEGVTLIGGSKLVEPYVSHQSGYNPKSDYWPLAGVNPVNVPLHHYFVLGDNRDGSMDSRAFGFISEDDVIGTVVIAARR
jgi:signal peptidase I